MNSSCLQHRQKRLGQAADKLFDVLVVGGGIVGAGIARDAALRGMQTAIIDRHDFAFGTSSRSSRLLHGGIRYLAQGRIRLVREASVEKMILHRIAPHLAEPLPLIFPAYRDASEWPFWQLRIGVKIYDLLCSGRNLGPSRSLTPGEVLKKVPQLEQNGLEGAVRYFDGFTQDARLVLDTLRSAERGGALTANYLRFLGAERRREEFTSTVRDELSGQTFALRSRAVVNATGPWSQQVRGSSVQLRLTKGVHLVFDREKLPIQETVVITEGMRVLFVIPWGERLIVGTTDTDYSGAPEAVRTCGADTDYLLRTLRRFFPGVGFCESDIISSWAGLRPLLFDARRGPSDISRSHRITQSQPGWWDVAGGKLTTYRLIAEKSVDQIASVLRGQFKECSTATEPLLPPAATRGVSQITPPCFSQQLVEHFCRQEWAVHLDDVLLRRSSWHFYDGPQNGRAQQCAEWMANLLGWSSEERAQELRAYELHTRGPLHSPSSEELPMERSPG